MKRIIPYPLMTVSLVLIWLILNQSFAIGQVLLGTVVAILACLILSLLGMAPPRIRFSRAIPYFAATVLYDIIRSNIAVAMIILSGRIRATSGFVLIPLETKNRYCLSALAIIITATPGTLWLEHDSRRNVLLLHVLDLVDEQYWIDLIKQRYERALMEIFE